MTTDTREPRIYVASLSDYNAGILHGEWIDAAQDPDVIAAEVAEMLAKSPTAKREGMPAEEWAIHDYDDFGDADLGEWASFENVSAVANAIAEHGDAYIAYASYVGSDYATVEGFEEAYAGEFDSERDFAYQLADDVGFEASNEWPGSCIDWDQAARELFMGDYAYVDGYVFRCL